MNGLEVSGCGGRKAVSMKVRDEDFGSFFVLFLGSLLLVFSSIWFQLSCNCKLTESL